MIGLDLGPPPTLVHVTPGSDGKFQINTTVDISLAHDVAIALPENILFRKTLPYSSQLSHEEINLKLKTYFTHFGDVNHPMVFDFQRLDENHIMVIATTEEIIKKTCEKVPSPLNIIAIDHESYAIARALQKTGKTTQKRFGFRYTENGKIKFHFFDHNHLTFYDESDKKETYQQFEDFKIFDVDNKPYFLALGLALRNDSDWNVAPKPTESGLRTHFCGIFFLMKCMVYSIALWAIAHAVLTSVVFSQKKYAQFLSYELKKEMAQSSSVQSQKIQIKTMQAQLQTLDKLRQQQQPSLTLLNTLSHVMPDGTFLTQLSLHDNQIQLTGLAVTEKQTKTLLKNLEKQQNIENPVLSNVQADNSEPPYHFSFSISASLRAIS